MEIEKCFMPNEYNRRFSIFNKQQLSTENFSFYTFFSLSENGIRVSHGFVGDNLAHENLNLCNFTNLLTGTFLFISPFQLLVLSPTL